MNDLHNALHCGIPEVVLGAVHDSEQQTTPGFTPDVYAVEIGPDSHAVSPLAKSCLAPVPLASPRESRNARV